MAQIDLVYFDIAAVVVMLVSLQSFLVRRKTHTPANRVYFSVLTLMLFTAIFAMAEGVYDLVLGLAPPTSLYPRFSRGLIQLLYYALRSLTAPAYLVLIATISGTTHHMNGRTTLKFLLWVPMAATLAFVLTNPAHHLVFTVHDGAIVRSVCIWVLYADAAYYGLIGVIWLFRWKSVLSDDEFATLMLVYPLAFLAVIVQYYLPYLHIEMFVSSVALMMVSAFVIRPERQMDSLVAAASLQAYRDMVNRTFATRKPRCLVYLEIVNMERLRDLVGKDEMEDIVSQINDSLVQTLETGDILYYLRNGLFCIAPVNPDAAQALATARKMQQEGRARDSQEPLELAVREMRICVVSVPQDVRDSTTLATLVRRLSHLVPDGRATSFAELSQKEDFELNMALPDIVARAIRERSFEVYYQPIYCPHHKSFHSAEALVRLNDPTYGFISPALFIPEAEQTGTILQIGDILLEKICAFLGKVDFADLGLDYVEVNLSTEQCIHPHMARELLRLLEEYGVSPTRINIEITESSAAFSQNIVEGNMRVLAKAGVTFSLDDYGTGYSNVTRALSLPFSLIKFDKSFVDGLENPTTHKVFAQSIHMMKDIGKKVLVEGVETEEQADAVITMGTDHIQGYLYAKPIPEDDFITFLHTHNA